MARSARFEEPAAHAAATIVLAVGAEGSGHHVLVNAARRRFGADRRYLFPVPIATRPVGETDEHLRVDRRTFARLLDEGALSAHWQADGALFGLPAGALQAPPGGLVVAAVSREAAGRLQETLTGLSVVEIGAAPATAGGGRRSAETLAAGATRLDAAGGPVPAGRSAAGLRIAHGGDLASAVRRFIDYLEQLPAEMGPPALPAPVAASRIAEASGPVASSVRPRPRRRSRQQERATAPA